MTCCATQRHSRACVADMLLLLTGLLVYKLLAGAARWMHNSSERICHERRLEVHSTLAQLTLRGLTMHTAHAQIGGKTCYKLDLKSL